jgi:branched-chain amino acid transport system permease protein
MKDATPVFYKIPTNYYLTLSCSIICYIFVKSLIHSPFGRILAAIAQNEERAEAIGYNIYTYKIGSLAISGGIAALAGALFAPSVGNIRADDVLGVQITIDVMIFSILGGLGTLIGPFFGAAFVEFANLRLTEVLTLFNIEEEWWLVILGIIYIFVVLFFPYGVVGTIQQKSLKITAQLRRIRIREADYWWLSLIIVFIAVFIINNLHIK